MFYLLLNRNLKKKNTYRSNFNLINELSWADRNKFSCLRNPRDKIIKCHFKGHGMIIIFFELPRFYDNHQSLLLENFYCQWSHKKNFQLYIQIECLDLNTIELMRLRLCKVFNLESDYIASKIK